MYSRVLWYAESDGLIFVKSVWLLEGVSSYFPIQGKFSQARNFWWVWLNLMKHIFKISIKNLILWYIYWYQNSVFYSFVYYWAGSHLTTVCYHELFDYMYMTCYMELPLLWTSKIYQSCSRYHLFYWRPFFKGMIPQKFSNRLLFLIFFFVSKNDKSLLP